MGSTHWLLLIPYYFFGALGSLLAMILLSRITRVRVSINVLATAAAVIGIVSVTLPILTGCLDVAAYSLARMLMLVAVTGLLALLDAVLEPRLSLPLDNELRALGER